MARTCAASAQTNVDQRLIVPVQRVGIASNANGPHAVTTDILPDLIVPLDLDRDGAGVLAQKLDGVSTDRARALVLSVHVDGDLVVGQADEGEAHRLDHDRTIAVSCPASVR